MNRPAAPPDARAKTLRFFPETRSAKGPCRGAAARHVPRPQPSSRRVRCEIRAILELSRRLFLATGERRQLWVLFFFLEKKLMPRSITRSSCKNRAPGEQRSRCQRNSEIRSAGNCSITGEAKQAYSFIGFVFRKRERIACSYLQLGAGASFESRTAATTSQCTPLFRARKRKLQVV